MFSWFQQDGASSLTSREALRTLKKMFLEHLISHRIDVPWPDFAPLNFYWDIWKPMRWATPSKVAPIEAVGSPRCFFKQFHKNARAGSFEPWEKTHAVHQMRWPFWWHNLKILINIKFPYVYTLDSKYLSFIVFLNFLLDFKLGITGCPTLN